jgi:hypothetical protein
MKGCDGIRGTWIGPAANPTSANIGLMPGPLIAAPAAGLRRVRYWRAGRPADTHSLTWR